MVQRNHRHRKGSASGLDLAWVLDSVLELESVWVLESALG
jgi:hypothetical protein